MKLHLTLCLVAALGITSAPVLPELLAESQPASGIRLAAATACEDVMVLGVDGEGSGWGDLAAAGPAVGLFGRNLEKRIAAAGGTSGAAHLGSAFSDASALVAGSLRRPAQEVVTRRSAKAWRSGVSAATDALVQQLRTRAAACPEQAFVLAGHAQGADTVHRALVRAEGITALAGRIVGAALVSDPDRVTGTRASLVGAPAAPAAGQGVFARVLTPIRDVPTAGQDLRVVSVCTQGDIVCDLGSLSAQRSLESHDSYSTPDGRRQVKAAAAQLAERAAAWPRVVGDQVFTTRPGVALAEQIALRVGTTYQKTAVFEATGPLPSGITLSSGGRLSGTLRTTGSWDVPVRVHNTSPVTSASTGTLTLRSVSAASTSALSGGGQSSCQVTAEGSAYCVGNNAYGQLGDGTSSDRALPVQVGAAGEWAGIDTSGATTCGVKDSGELWCWGMNNRGQLGLGAAARKLYPQRVGGSSAWAQVSTSWLHTCAVRTSGSLWCWGENNDGQLGIGTLARHDTPVRVGTDNDWASVTTGGWHTCATRTDGSAWCWGRNDLGQLGTGNRVRQLRPTPIDSQRTWSSLDATWSSTCGLTQSSRILCWGLNDQGQLGDGTKARHNVPTLVAGTQDWTSVTVGDAHTCGLDSRGAAWCWGSNKYGELGTGTTQGTTLPAKVAGNLSWIGLDAGWMHTCAISLGDELQCWGNNERGQLGRGDRVDRVTPPGVRAGASTMPRRAQQKNVVVTSFNVLGSQHTEPGGGAGTYAPGRIRSEWTGNMLDDLGSGIVSLQELQVDQYRNLKRSVGDRYDFYPGSTKHKRVVWQSVMWDKSQWSLVEARNIVVPVIGTTRPNPMVRLRNRFTGMDVWVLNVHNSSKNRPDRQRERNRAVKIEISNILAERRKQTPVLFMGDMNERERVYCKVTGRTDLEAVTGGSHVGSACRPPRRMHFDWIFASPELPILGHAFIRNGKVIRITDHSILTSTLGLS